MIDASAFSSTWHPFLSVSPPLCRHYHGDIAFVYDIACARLDAAADAVCCSAARWVAAATETVATAAVVVILVAYLSFLGGDGG